MSRFSWILAGIIPLSLRQAVVVRAFAQSTTGEWSHEESPALLAVDMYKRMK